MCKFTNPDINQHKGRGHPLACTLLVASLRSHVCQHVEQSSHHLRAPVLVSFRAPSVAMLARKERQEGRERKTERGRVHQKKSQLCARPGGVPSGAPFASRPA